MTTLATEDYEAQDGIVLTHPVEGPCSEEEARTLVNTAIKASETFYDTMAEMIRRQAWDSLGYSGMRELVVKEFTGTAINPATGKTYSRSHSYRMARTALFMFSISEKTGVAAGELALSERSLRKLPAGVQGDDDLVDEIKDKVDAAGLDKNASPDDVNEIIGEVLQHASGERSEEFDEDEHPAHMASMQGEQQGSGASSTSGRGTDKAGVSGSSFDDEDDDDVDVDDVRPARSSSPANDAFAGGDEDDDFAEPQPHRTPFGDALGQVRGVMNFSRTLDQISEIAGHLPDVAKVEKELPEFLDVIDDDELPEFMTRLETSMKSLKNLEAAMKALEATADEAQQRAEDV